MMRSPTQDIVPRSRTPWIFLAAAILALLALPRLLPPDGMTHPGQFLGRFHVGLIHLPVGLLLLLPVFEIAGRRRPALREAAAVTLWIAAATGFVAALLGILLAHAGAFPAAEVRRHMWPGIALAIAALLFAQVRPLLKSDAAIPLSLALALGTVWTAHTGGAIVYGGRWLTEYAPSLSGVFGPSRNYPPVNPNGPYAQTIQPILNANCIKCHAPEKRKGGLAVDTFAHVMNGGASGDVISPGAPDRSILLQRVTLPSMHPKFMPQEGKPLSAADIAALRAWIAAGASPDAKQP